MRNILFPPPTLRRNLSLVFLLIALVMVGLAAMSVRTLYGVAQDAVVLEADHLADSVAYTGVADAIHSPEFLQRYIAGLDEMYRQVVIVDQRRIKIAGSGVEGIGQPFHGDPNDEVGRTLADGESRTFTQPAPGGANAPMARQMVVPVHATAQSDSPVVGAVVLEYSQLYDELLQRHRAALIAIVSASLICVAFAVWLGLGVASGIGRRVRGLQQGVTAIAGGHYAARVDDSSADEFGALGAAFNSMAADLARAHAQLLEQQRTLQAQVDARTVELTRANALLTHEVEEGRRSADRIETLAYYDGLTGLPNRTMFGKLLTQSIALAQRHQRQLGVFFLDLDRFKLINDTLGHEAGDALLQIVGQRLRDTLRASDTVARLGGDEFVVMVPEVECMAQLEHVAQKLLSVIAKSCQIAGQEFRVTGSLGISMYPTHGDDEQTLMKAADIAMYRAKDIGKNRYQVYSAGLSAQSLHRLTMESSLRDAVDRGEFRVHYQPKVDTVTRIITGVEALVRWQHPSLGMVSPADFIPLAEETGLIVPIGLWVLRTACEQSVQWQRAGHPALMVAVNLSARQFADDNLLADIQQVLRDTGMQPQLLELEITESMLMRDVNRALEVLHTLRGMQVHLALDDFGTGYSSLATLKRFPLNTIKIDRSFIQDLAHDADDRAITEAIIAMGLSLGLTVVAEGVETEAQISFLQQHACDQMQGYYFSKPLPADQCTLLLNGRPAAETGATRQSANDAALV